MDKFGNYIKLIRPQHWIKNFLIFAPLFFGQKLFDAGLFMKTTAAFAGFSLVASGMYIVNDYFDINEDRQNPGKKSRPLASGKISTKAAFYISAFCLLVGLLISVFWALQAFYILAGYIVLNILYNFKLKHVAIIDVCTVSAMYVIRLFVGSEASGISLSMWIILLTFFMAMFVSLAKRRDDVIYLSKGIKTRKVANGYNLEYLDIATVIMASIVVVSYIMFTVSPVEMAKVHSGNLYLTSIFVVLALLRYIQAIIVEGRHGSPVRIFTEDRFIQLTVLGWIISSGIFFYL
ncbi:MAG: UbiA prenyltransferase family protein [Candidatus Staskawiczbacteria bacterium]|jgi:4-hydroxybenzoate polyprenyltransferase